jgi:glycine/D-amino acid oxidase-like deaminating enzyme
LEEIAARGAQWRKRGAPVRVLDAAETARKVGSTRYPGALLDERAGTIQPLAYVRGLARAAIAAGAQLFGGSPVQSFARDGARWVVTTPGGRVRADWIVVATNAYTVDTAGVPWREVRTELVPLPYFQFATEPLPAEALASILPERQGAWDTKQVLSSFRLDRAGRLIFGSVGALRHGGAAVHRAWALRAIRRIFPNLGPVKFEAGWFGRIGMTDDSVPRFHAPAPNVVGFSGYNGRGIAPGTVFGRVLARHILGTEDEMPLPTTSAVEAKHRGVKGAYYEAGAQVAHIVEERT